jgi:hypothetical protein
MTRDWATNTIDCELPDVQAEATNSSLFCTVLHFSKCLTQQTAFTMTNILNACYIVSSAAMYIAMTGIPLPRIVFHSTLVLYVSVTWR